jgi:EAL domain-containing protein (putative c-di-GMP-specific phosphodiesterase class I)
MSQSAADLEIVRSINAIGHIMGKQTVAECVGDQTTWDALRDLGVDFAQGFWLGKPAPLPH